MSLSIERELAADIIDLVEDKIRKEHPDIDKIASEFMVDEEHPNTLLYGEAYYDLENTLTEKIIESRSKLLEECKLSKDNLMTIASISPKFGKNLRKFASKAFSETEDDPCAICGGVEGLDCSECPDNPEAKEKK